MADAAPDTTWVDLLAAGAAGHGACWSHAGEQLNATLLSWAPGHEVAAHVNREREVLLVCVSGGGTVVVDERAHDLHPGVAIVVARGAERSISAGAGGLAYVSTHLARPGLELRPRLRRPVR